MSTTPVEMHVLVIDDQRFQRSFLVRMLREMGIQHVQEACNGENAVSLLTATTAPFDLIISDIDMPKMDGLEFLRWLGRMAPQTPILIHSALEHDLLRSVEAMAVEYGLTPIGILKDPVTTERLRVALERARLNSLQKHPAHALEVNCSAIENGMQREEFETWFQPKLDLRTGRVLGVEALLRWRRGQHVLLPAQFLAELESSGLIRECTLRVATHAGECIRLVPGGDNDFSVAINIAVRLLDEPSFIDDLCNALGAAGVKPEQIIVELTEKAMAGSQGVLLENLARLRMRGFRVSLDDFGIGNSSMARLIRSPFCEIKLDRSIVGRMYEGNREWLFIESTIALAQRLGLHTVAEGVETEQQLLAVEQFGCDSAQGSFMAKPMPLQELLRWLEYTKTDAGSQSGSDTTDLRCRASKIAGIE